MESAIMILGSHHEDEQIELSFRIAEVLEGTHPEGNRSDPVASLTRQENVPDPVAVVKLFDPCGRCVF
jgi:hypothetical protein